MQDGEIHLWQVSLDVADDAAPRLLSSDELERAARIRDPRRAARFRRCRAILRRLLGDALGRDPAELVFHLSGYGKPELADLANHQLHFNVTHSDSVAFVGLRRGGPLGVDVERIRPEFAVESIAARFFSVRERKTLMSLPAEERVEAFFRCWTRKEAFIKAVGEGLSYPLDEFDVTLRREEPAAVVAVRGNMVEARNWRLEELEAPEEFVAAFACEGIVTSVVSHQRIQ